MTAYAKAIIAAVVFVLGLATGWTAQGWRKDVQIQALRTSNAEVLADIATKTSRALEAVQRAGRIANAAINEADRAATERIAKNDQENRSLRECVRAGTCGVRIVTRTVHTDNGSGAADSTSGSVGDAAVELDQATGLRVLDLRESVQLDAEKLDYLQRYADVCWRAGVEAVK